MKTISVAPVLKVADLTLAVSHYEQVLRFEQSFRVGTYAGVKLGQIELHLSQAEGQGAKSTVYIFCDRVDEYFAEVKARGAQMVFEPKDWPYGMRDFRVRDLDGNEISFGCHVAHA